MNVLITGGAGFLGQLLIRELLARGRLADSADERADIACITVLDQVVPEQRVIDARVRYLAGDAADAALLARALEPGTQAVFHLAAVVSGSAEADFDLGMRVNLDGTRALLDACRAQAARGGPLARLLFSSSVAVFGGDLPDIVTDATTPTPQGSYGVQKLIGEYLIGDYTRKGYIDGRAVRVPTIVVRPGKPNGAASGFASGMLREPLAGIDAICPVEPDTEMWIASPRQAIISLLQAYGLTAAQWGWKRSLNLPGLTVRVGDMVDALREVGGDAAAARVHWQPDEKIKAIVQTWPARFDTARATAMGFAADRSMVEILRAYLADHGGPVSPP